MSGGAANGDIAASRTRQAAGSTVQSDAAPPSDSPVPSPRTPVSQLGDALGTHSHLRVGGTEGDAETYFDRRWFHTQVGKADKLPAKHHPFLDFSLSLVYDLFEIK